MKYIKIILKGILIGFASVGIPGLSASTIAIILGIYYLMIDSISKIFKDFKKSISFLLSLLVGYGIGALIAGNVFSILFAKYPLAITLLILGFVIGSIPKLYKEIKPNIKSVSNWIVVIVIWALLLTFTFAFFKADEVELFFDMPLKNWILLVIVGLLTSGTLVIPGMDYVVVLLSLGYYQAIMGLLNLFSDSIIWENLVILSAYLASYGIGAFLISKFISKYKEKHEVKMKFANFAFVSIAPIIIVKQSLLNNDDFIGIANDHKGLIIGIILFIIAFGFVCLFNHLTDPNDKRPKAMKKRNMFRFFHTIMCRFPLPLIYIHKMKKMIKDDTLSFEEKYRYCVKVMKHINKLGNIYVQKFGEENLTHDGTLYISNHQGRYDGIGIFTTMEEYPMSLLAIKSRINFPMYREMFTMLNGVVVDPDNMRNQVKLMKQMGDRLANDESFLVFIEGIYGDNENTLQEFKTGVLHPAYQSKCPITPIVLYDSYKVFSISSLRKIYPEVHYLKQITYDEYKDLSKKELADLIKTRMQEKIDELNKLKGRN